MVVFALLIGWIGVGGCDDDRSGQLQGGGAFCSTLGVAPTCSDEKTVARCLDAVTSGAESAPNCGVALEQTLTCISYLSLECTSSSTSVARGDEAGSERACIRASDGTDYCVDILDGLCAQRGRAWKDCVANGGEPNGAHKDTQQSGSAACSIDGDCEAPRVCCEGACADACQDPKSGGGTTEAPPA